MKKTRTVAVGNVLIGGGNPISVQSMTNTHTEDISATLNQCDALLKAGCEVIRVSFPTVHSIGFIKEYKNNMKVPLVADIHFDHQLAIMALEAGADKIRINPGNIGSQDNVRRVIHAARANAKAIRIGVNGGSLPIGQDPTSPYLPAVQTAMEYIRFFEQEQFSDIVISVKMSDVPATIRAYEEMAALCDYPLHLGVTEAGTRNSGIVKSAVGIGSVLSRGIGDTIRVSLTGDPVYEIDAARQILKSLALRSFGPNIIACPTCSRTQVELERIALEVESRLKDVSKSLTIAIMGCAVNGPGEARHADVGVACGKGEGLLFRKGEVIQKVAEARIIDELIRMVDEF